MYLHINGYLLGLARFINTVISLQAMARNSKKWQEMARNRLHHMSLNSQYHIISYSYIPQHKFATPNIAWVLKSIENYSN